MYKDQLFVKKNPSKISYLNFFWRYWIVDFSIDLYNTLSCNNCILSDFYQNSIGINNAKLRNEREKNEIY